MPSYHVVTPEGKVRQASRQEVRALRWLPEKVEIPLRRTAETARKGLMALCVNVNPKGDHRANQNGTHPEHHARHWSPAPEGAGRDNSDISQPTAHATVASRGIGTTPR